MARMAVAGARLRKRGRLIRVDRIKFDFEKQRRRPGDRSYKLFIPCILLNDAITIVTI